MTALRGKRTLGLGRIGSGDTSGTPGAYPLIILYLLAALAAVIAYAVASRLGRAARVAIALAVFLVPSVAMTALVIKVGDQPLPGSVTFQPG